MTPEITKRIPDVNDMYDGAEVVALFVEIPKEVYEETLKAYHDGLDKKKHILSESEWFGGLLCGGVYACTQNLLHKPHENSNQMQADILRWIDRQVNECATEIAGEMKSTNESQSKNFDRLDGKMDALNKFRSMVAGCGRI